jgi:hypothetical protein
VAPAARGARLAPSPAAMSCQPCRARCRDGGLASAVPTDRSLTEAADSRAVLGWQTGTPGLLVKRLPPGQPGGDLVTVE